MKNSLAVLTSLLAALLLASGGHGAVRFGVTEDAGKYADDGGVSFFATLDDLGMTENRVAVFWDAAHPTEIQEQAFLDRSLPVAAAAGIRIVFSVQPLHPTVVPSIDVIGLGLSPRGNDNPRAASNISTSPVRFIHDLGVAYRASGRTRPIMDELAFHPYPNPSSADDPLFEGYQWPNAGVPNLARIKQAVWDAFAGTAQPTFAEAGWSVPGPAGAAPAAPPPTPFLHETGW